MANLHAHAGPSHPAMALVARDDDDHITDKDALTGAAGALVGSYTDKLSSVDTMGVITQAGMMALAAGAALAFYFLLLRPHMRSHLAPRTKLGKRLDRLAKKHFKADGWPMRVWEGIKEAHQSVIQSEEDHLIQSGLDSVAYLRLLWLNMTSFGLITLFTFPILVWVDWKAHNKGKLWANAKLGKIQLKDFTITGVKDGALYWHVGCAYGITVIVLCLVYWNSYQMEKLRVAFFTNPALIDRPSDIYKRCAMIADIGDDTAAVTEVLTKNIQNIPNLQDETFVVKVFSVYDPEGRARRMQIRNDLVTQLQKVLTMFLEGKMDGSEEGDQPMIRPPGSLTLTSKKEPALQYFRRSLENLKMDHARQAEKNKSAMQTYAVVAFDCAGNVSEFLRHCVLPTGGIAGWDMDFAPTPSGIIWRNIRLNHGIRATSYMVGYLALVILLVIYTPPLAFIALLSNVAAVTRWSPTLKRWQDDSPTMFRLTTMTVPPILSAMLFSLLPKIIEFVAHYQGAKTTRSLQSRTIHWYLAFLVLAQLVVLPSLSTVLTIITRVADEQKGDKSKSLLLKIWVDIIFFFTSLPGIYQQQANYWLNWLALRWLLVAIQLAQAPWLLKGLASGIWRRLTAQQKVVEIAPAEYTIRIPQNMFLIVLGLLYAPLVPFIPPFLLTALIMQYCIHKIQARVLFKTQSETTARFWLPEMDRLLLFLLPSHGCLALTCSLQAADARLALATAPACVIVVFFRFWLRSRFNNTLLMMMHDHAMVKTSFEADINEKQLDAVFGFSPKGKKLVFSEDIEEAAKAMLFQAGLDALWKIDDAFLTELNSNDPNKRAKAAEAMVAQRDKRAREHGATRARFGNVARAVGAFAVNKRKARDKAIAEGKPPDPEKEFVEQVVADQVGRIQAGQEAPGASIPGTSASQSAKVAAAEKEAQDQRKRALALGAMNLSKNLPGPVRAKLIANALKKDK